MRIICWLQVYKAFDEEEGTEVAWNQVQLLTYRCTDRISCHLATRVHNSSPAPVRSSPARGGCANPLSRTYIGAAATVCVCCASCCSRWDSDK